MCTHLHHPDPANQILPEASDIKRRSRDDFHTRTSSQGDTVDTAVGPHDSTFELVLDPYHVCPTRYNVNLIFCL